uniref:TGF-beta propeptide domain-containing protein n=1 Tax=Romanomermis culicivorax TaxID=13658 RepID=A0A915IAU7_ROMCU
MLPVIHQQWIIAAKLLTSKAPPELPKIDNLTSPITVQKMFSPTFILSFFVLLFLIDNSCTSFRSGFYADNGYTQTIPLEVRLSEKRKFQKEVLQFLGLNSPPRKRFFMGEPVPSYMLELFKYTQNHETDGEPNLSPQFSFPKNHGAVKDDISIDLFDPNEADTIMSFTDQSLVTYGDESTKTRRILPPNNRLHHLLFDIGDNKNRIKNKELE